MNPPAKNPDATLRTRKYRAFISYSQAADERLAPALREGLQNFSKPWYRLRALRIFCDQTGLSATPALWDSIERALKDSDFFILLASPQSAASKWVEQEVDWWLDHRSSRELLIILTEGELHWDDAAGDFDWNRSNALNRRLSKVFPEEPLYIDLRWAESETHLSLRRPRFAESVARLAATLHGKSLDELVGEDIRQHANTLRLVRFGVVGLLVLTTLALLTAGVALQARRTATRMAKAGEVYAENQARESQSRRLAEIALNEVADPDLRILLAAEALRIHPTDTAVNVLRRTLAGPLEPELNLELSGSSLTYPIPNPMETQLVLWGETQARLCDGAGQLRHELPLPAEEIFHVSFSRDGKRLATVSRDGVTRIWNTGTGERVLELPPVDAVAAVLNSDGSRLVTLTAGSEAILWNSVDGTRIVDLEMSALPFLSDHVPNVDFSPTTNRLAVCTRFDPVILDSNTGKIVMTLSGHTRPVQSIAFSPDGNWMVTASDDGTVRKWRNVNGQVAATFSHGAELRDASFSPDGGWVAARDMDGQLIVWEAESGRPTARVKLRDAPGSPLFFTFSPNGQCVLAAAFDDGPAELIDSQSGDRLATLNGLEGERRTLHFSPDGRRALVGNFRAPGHERGPAQIFPCDLCGSADDLLALAKRRVSRALTAAERAKYF